MEITSEIAGAMATDGAMPSLHDDPSSPPEDNPSPTTGNDNPSPTTGNDDPGATGSDNPGANEGSPCSFTPSTVVQTDHGEQPIGSLQVGEHVLAYNPKTKKMEYEPILHVWVHPDDDLVDLTLTVTIPASHGKPTKQISEVIHTNSKHPFLTVEKGFLPVGQIRVGMHVLRADGLVGVVTAWKLVPGIRTMYNLEVQQDHTFTVGDGGWVVHNCGDLNGSYPSLPKDVYRGVRTPDSSDLTQLRPGIEIRQDGTVKSGLSHFDSQVPLPGVQKWYKLPAGTPAPQGLQWVFKWSDRWGAYHVGLEPIGPMSAQDYGALVAGLPYGSP